MKTEVIMKGSNSLETVKNQFFNYLDVSETTLDTYRKGIECFLKYLNAKNIKQPTRNDLRGFRDELKEKASVNTVNSYLTSVRRFFGFLETNKLYEDISKDVKSIKTAKIPKKQVLTIEKAKEIYSQLTDLRQKCLFSLAITTGLRGIEMANARIQDIKIHNGELVLFVKCKKHEDYDEYVKLSGQVYNDILDYTNGRTEGYIFTSTSNNNKGSGVTTTTLRNEIKKIFNRFGLNDDTFSLHSMRRSSATFMYMNGQSVYDIQQVLHHASLTTSVRYINGITRNNNKSEYVVSKAILG